MPSSLQVQLTYSRSFSTIIYLNFLPAAVKCSSGVPIIIWSSQFSKIAKAIHQQNGTSTCHFFTETIRSLRQYQRVKALMIYTHLYHAQPTTIGVESAIYSCKEEGTFEKYVHRTFFQHEMHLKFECKDFRHE